MEILEMLQNQADDLFPEELDALEAELAAGDYDSAYRKQCRSLLEQIRAVRKQPAPADQKGGLSGAVISRDSLSPQDEREVVQDVFSRISGEVIRLRSSAQYKSGFRSLVESDPELTEEFINQHFTFFQPCELGTIVSVKPLSEEFLERWFSSLETDKIARYQLFSESFFMKHFNDFYVPNVLTKGKNPWRKKGKRSKQLDVFLRLRGVKL